MIDAFVVLLPFVSIHAGKCTCTELMTFFNGQNELSGQCVLQIRCVTLMVL